MLALILLLRLKKLMKTGHKIVLTREESLIKINQAVNVVEGANLINNEYGNRLFC